MPEDTLRSEFEGWSRKHDGWPEMDYVTDAAGEYAGDVLPYQWDGYQAAALPRDKRIAELEAELAGVEKDAVRLRRIMPLFEEARDALGAISLTAAKLHNVDLTLADRMDDVGIPSRYDTKYPDAARQQEGAK